MSLCHLSGDTDTEEREAGRESLLYLKFVFVVLLRITANPCSNGWEELSLPVHLSLVVRHIQTPPVQVYTSVCWH